MMIEKILTSHRMVVDPLSKMVTIMRLNFEYYLKVQIIPVEDLTEEFVSCETKVLNISDRTEELLHHKFYNKCSIKFNCVNIKPASGSNEYCWVAIILEFPPDTECLFFIELIEIEKNIIEDLNLTQTRKTELYKIIDSYLKEDYEEAINKMCIFGEFIAKELANKIEKKDRDFNGAINTLSHYNLSEKAKINYNFFGSLLTPIYFVRNQKLHPYSKLDFDISLSEMLFINLSSIIDNLNENQIKL